MVKTLSKVTNSQYNKDKDNEENSWNAHTGVKTIRHRRKGNSLDTPGRGR